MDTILGLLGMAIWIVATIGIAAGITFVVVKFFPGGDSAKQPSQS